VSARLRDSRFWTVFVVFSMVGLVGVRLFWLRPFKIPTGAMEKTILIGDCLLADMRAYGVRMPFTEQLLFGEKQPQRGDLIVFRFPEDPSRLFIKRVIGLPGETVAMRGPGVYINGRLLPESYALHGGGPFSEPAPLRERLPERLEDAAADPENTFRNYGPETVPAEALFVLGDNRDNSRDSRFWGFLPLHHVRGRVWCVYFSQEGARGASSQQGLGKVRWSRIGHRPR